MTQKSSHTLNALSYKSFGNETKLLRSKIWEYQDRLLLLIKLQVEQRCHGRAARWIEHSHLSLPKVITSASLPSPINPTQVRACMFPTSARPRPSERQADRQTRMYGKQRSLVAAGRIGLRPCFVGPARKSQRATRRLIQFGWT